MAYKTRKTADSIAFALAKAWNDKQEASVASFFHADITQITSGHYTSPVVANDVPPTDATTVITFTNALKLLTNRHFADARAHNSAVSAAITTADGTDITTACTLATAIKAAYGTHLSASNVHHTNDATNTIAAANATDSATAITLLTELRTDMGAHIISAPLGAMIELTGA
jgi:hypothetical protein